MRNVLAFTLGVDHPSGRLRVAAYADHFLKHGWRLELHAFDSGMGKASARDGSVLSSLARRLNRQKKSLQAAAVLRHLPPKDPIIISRELPVSVRPFLEAPNPMVLDIDDALYLESGRERLFSLCQRAQAVVCGNQLIADHLSTYARRCVVIPTVVDPDLYQVRTDYEYQGPLRLGWLGSSMSFDQTLSPWLPVLGEIQAQIPFELLVISDEFSPALHDKNWLRYLKWSTEVETSLARHMDVGIMPLQDNPYQTAKCGAKLVQYMAAGLPVIATPIGVNRELIIDGVTGCSASTPEEWRKAVELLMEPAKRKSFGWAGREHMTKHYSITIWSEKWAALLDEISK